MPENLLSSPESCPTLYKHVVMAATIESIPLVMSSSTQHIPSLDGIRAAAVAIVFMAHAGLDHIIPGGFGVTVFFFLSGFLITSLLRQEYDREGKIHLKRFYLRRIIRIWPPMYLALAVVLVLCKLDVVEFANPFNEALLFQLIHVGNYQQIYGQSAGMPGTSVLWSLAVEEHFYLFWPPVFCLLYSRWSPRQLSTLLWGMCLAVLVWRCVLVEYWHVSEWRTYAATDARIDSIMFGCILALSSNPFQKNLWSPPRVQYIGWLCASGILLAAAFAIRNPVFRETLRYTVQGVALIPLFYLAVSQPGNLLFRWLNWPGVRFIGVLSYSIYLSHFVILHVLTRTHEGHPLLVACLAAAATIAYAIFVHYLVERPLHEVRKKLRG